MHCSYKHRSFAIIGMALVGVVAVGCSQASTGSTSSTGVAPVASSVMFSTSIGGSTASGSPSASTVGSSATLATESGKPKIGFITINEQDAFFVDLTKGMQSIAKQNGIDLAVTDPGGDVTKQIAAVEDYTNAKFDVVIIDAADSNAVVPALTAARQAGVKVVAVDAVITAKDAIDTQVGLDNAKIGAEIGDIASKYIQTHLGDKAEVGIVTVLQSQIQLERVKGFTTALAGHAGVKIYPAVDGKYSTDTALTAAENLLTAHPNMNIAYATGQGTVEGLMAAGQAQGRDVKIFGWNLDKKIAEGIQNGTVVATANQNPSDFGTKAMQAALDLAAGKTVPALIEVPTTIVTKDNLANNH